MKPTLLSSLLQPGRFAPRFAAFLLASAAIVALQGCDRLIGADERIERARTALEAGQYAAAMADAKAALEAEPDNAEGRSLLARVLLQLGDVAGARKELDRAIEAGMDPAVVRDLHYDILLAEGRYQDALISAAVDEDLEQVKRLTVMATAQTALGQHDQAEATINEAVAMAAEDREVRLIQARSLWARGKLPDAMKVLTDALERDPEFARGWLYKGRFALGVGDAEQGRASFAEARKLMQGQLDLPDQLSVLTGLIESKLALGDLAGAQSDLADLERRAPSAFPTRYLKARLAFAKRDYRVAAAELQRLLTAYPDNPSARLLLGASLFEQGSLEQANSELSSLVADQPNNVEARKLLARVYMAQNDSESARRVLAALPSLEVRDTGTEWLTGAVLLMGRKSAEAVATLEQAAAADPDNIPLRLDLVTAYVEAGQREKAAEVLGSIPASEGGRRRRQLSFLVEIVGRNPNEARQGVERLVKENAEDAELLTIAGAYFGQVGDTQSAGELFKKAAAVDPRNVNARVGLAVMAYQSGNRAGAAEQLRSVIEIDPQDERAYVGLAEIAAVEHDRPAARQWLERAISTNPQAVDARLKLAGEALADGDVDQAKSLVEQAVTVAKDKTATLNRAGQIYMQASRYDDALTRFSAAASAGSPEGDINAAGALLALGRTDEAKGRLEAVAAKRRDWTAPVTMLAAIDASQGRIDQALVRVADYEKASGDSFGADFIRGDVLTAAGRHGDAADAYARAATIRPTAELAIRNFRATKAAGRASPESSLVAWLKDHPQDQSVRVMLAEHRQLEGDRKAAIAEYERAAAGAATAPVLNNLAWLYYETGDPRAEDLAKRAHESAPENAEIADTYGWILVEKNRAEEGLKVLEIAIKGSPEHPEIRYHYAVALARVGRTQQAVVALRDLVDAVQTFPSRNEAEALLLSLTKG